MRKFSNTRRRLKQTGLVAAVLLLVVMAGSSFWFFDYVRIQPPRTILLLVLGWFALVIVAMTCVLFLLRDWHKGNVTPYCPNCDYDLTGNETGRCPECGHTIPPGDLTLSGRPPLVRRNPLEALQDALSGRHSRGTKVFLIYLVYVGIITAVTGGCIWIVAHGCPLFRP